MSFLASVVGYVLTWLLGVAGGWLAKVIHIAIQDAKTAASDEAKTAQVTKELQDAKNAADLEKAAKDAANNFSGK